MFKQDTPLYYYRFFTLGGHVFRCLSEFCSIYDLSDHLKDLEDKEMEFETLYLTKNDEIVHVMIKPGDIVAKEQVLNQGPISLQEHAKVLQPHRAKIIQKNREERKLLAGQIVGRK